MKRFKLGAAVIGLLLACSQARAQTAGTVQYKALPKMDEAMDRLKSAMSKGGTEGVANSGDAVFTTLADFTRPAVDDSSVVRSESLAQPKRKAGLVKVACWEVCVKLGPLNVCYAWETKCK